MRNLHTLTRTGFLGLAFILLTLILTPALAQVKPALTIMSVFRPGLTLDSAPGDLKYVDIEIYINGNVQFWAVDFACTVRKEGLLQYVFDNGGGGTPADSGDNVPMVNWSGEWGAPGAEHIAFPERANYTNLALNGYNPATGELRFSATRLGTAAPLGQNGVNYNLLLATVRFQVADLADGTTLTSGFDCKTVQVLDRDGLSIVKPSVTKPIDLRIQGDYIVTGSVLYQASKSAAGVGVTCDYLAGADPVVTVTTAGAYSFKARNLGTYECTFFGNKVNPSPTQEDDLYLAGKTRIELTSSSFHLLPVILRSGNLDRSAGPINDEVIDALDAGLVTAAWNTTDPAIIAQRDVNGDGKVNELDLAIIGGNFDLAESVDYSHMVFGLARDYVTISPPNARIWWGDTRAGAVLPLVDSKVQDFWPMVSPDGAWVVITRYDSKTKRYTLAVVDIKAPPKGKATVITPKGYDKDAFAASWSPDGQRIAFICASTDYFGGLASSGWALNQGNLCIMDANGRNFRQVTTTNTVKIFPPAWFDNDVVIFAGSSTDTTCANDLCYYDFKQNQLGVVNTNLATGGNVADMPLIQQFDGTTYLFYRFNNTVTTGLRVGTITYNGTAFSGGITAGVPTANLHQNVGDDVNDVTFLITNVDYYDVSPTMNIVLYQRGDSTLHNLYYTGNLGDWEDPANPIVTHRVDGFTGNPSWNGDPGIPTDLHALRATIDWIP